MHIMGLLTDALDDIECAINTGLAINTCLTAVHVFSERPSRSKIRSIAAGVHRRRARHRRATGLRPKPSYDALSQLRDQTRVDRFGEDENRCATQAIDRVIGGAPQAEPFAGYVPAWQISETAVIDAHVAVSMEKALTRSTATIGFDGQAPPLAFVPQFQQGVLQQRQSAGLTAHVLHE
jgi:hypothetical protein